MHRPRFLCALGLSLLSLAAAGAQAPPSPALSTALRGHLKTERFQIVTSVRGLPLGVRDAMQTLFGSPTLDIAERGADFQATDNVVNEKLPIRRLVAAGCSMDHCLVYYERGGVAHVWLAVLFHWTPDATRIDAAGTAPNSLTTVDDLRNAFLSGAIKGPNKFW